MNPNRMQLQNYRDFYLFPLFIVIYPILKYFDYFEKIQHLQQEKNYEQLCKSTIIAYVQRHTDRVNHANRFQECLNNIRKVINYTNIELLLTKRKYEIEHRIKMKPNLNFVRDNKYILEKHVGAFKITDAQKLQLTHKGKLEWKIMKKYVPDGKGMERSENYFFEGTYANGKKKFGRLYDFKSKEIFYGLFENDEKIDGIISMPNGRRYEGSFKKNEPDGNGFLVFHDGSYFDGVFVQGDLNKGLFYNKKETKVSYFENFNHSFRDEILLKKMDKNFFTRHSV